MYNAVIISSNIKRLREYYGYSQNSIASFLDINHSLLSKYEVGEKNISIDMLEKLAVLFDIPVVSFSKDDLEVCDENQLLKASNINDQDLKIIYVISKIYDNIKNMDRLMLALNVINDLKLCNVNKIANIKMDERIMAELLRIELGNDITSPIDIYSAILSQNNTTIVFYPMGERLSGVSIKDKRNLVIGINSQLNVGEQRFTIVQELYNAYFCNNHQSICYRNHELIYEIDNKVNKFAAYFLIPFHSLYDKINKRKIGILTIEDIIDLEQYYGVSRKVILYRLVIDNIITIEEADTFANSPLSSVILQGYDDALYRPYSKEKQYMTFGRYIRQANELYHKNIISKGKYEELLLDAFRTDIVYGEGIEENEIID